MSGSKKIKDCIDIQQTHIKEYECDTHSHLEKESREKEQKLIQLDVSVLVRCYCHCPLNYVMLHKETLAVCDDFHLKKKF